MNDARLDETTQLIRQAKSGREEAFERLFDLHRKYLLRVVELRLDARVRPRVDCCDVVQETYLEAHRRFGDYLTRPHLPFRLWLRRIACDESLKARRRHRETARRSIDREITLPDQSSRLLVQRLQGMASTPSRHLQQQETAREVRRAIAQLPQHEREVIVMRHYEGLSNQEIGLLLDIEPATVSRRHGRAMIRLHKLLFESDSKE